MRQDCGSACHDRTSTKELRVPVDSESNVGDRLATLILSKKTCVEAT